MEKVFILTLQFVLLLSQLLPTYSQSLPTAWTQGTATNYGGAQDGMDPSSPSFGTMDGSCGYGLLNPNVYPYWSVAALSLSNQYSIAGPSQGCGQCFEIQCLNSGGQYAGRCSSSQSVIVTITDSCPQCEANHIDIQALTFNKIAPMAVGLIDIQYRRVDCTPPLPVSIDVDNNVGAGGWLRLVVEKTAGFGGITSVGMRTTGTQSWLAMQNKFGSAWEVSNTPGLPWDFQFTSDNQQTVVAPSLIMSNGQVGTIPTGVQFSLSGSTGTTNISYDSEAPGAGGATPPAVGASPPTTPAAAVVPPSSGGSCVDVTPQVAGGSITCAQQAGYGKCNDSWMVSGNYCQATCGRCGGQSIPPSAAGATLASQGQSPAPHNSPPPSSPGGSPPPSSPGGSPPPSSPGGSPPPSSPGGNPPPPAPTTGSNYGSVQTYSISSPPPAACSDQTPPGFSSCADALSQSPGACYSTLQAPYCQKSCYRC